MLHKLAYNYGKVNILYGNHCRNQLLKGVKLVQRAAAVTLGPHGKNVAIEYEPGQPKITKDGVTVCQNVYAPNRSQDLGAYIMRISSHQTNKYAGDGTTSSILLASSLFESGQKYVQAGFNPIFLARGIQKGKQALQEFLEAIATPVSTDEQLRSAAMLACNYDGEIGECVYEIIKEIGVKGMVSIEPGGNETHIEIANGFKLLRGCASEKLLDEGSSASTLSYPYILTSGAELRSMKDLVGVLEAVQEVNGDLFLVAPDISEEVLSNLVFNKVKGILRVCAITVPGFGRFAKEVIEDLSLVCGARLLESGEQPELADLGRCVKVETDLNECQVIGGDGDEQRVQWRIEQLENELRATSKDNERQILKDRLQRLFGKIGVVYIGGRSEVEMNENRDKLVDSLNAAKTTMQHGMLPGGYAALLNAAKILPSVPVANQDENEGLAILRSSIESLLLHLSKNGKRNYKEIINRINSQHDFNFGYDQRNDRYGNLLQLGVVDSLQVVKTSLEDGVSLGCMLLSTDVAIIQAKEYIPTPLKNYRKEMF